MRKIDLRMPSAIVLIGFFASLILCLVLLSQAFSWPITYGEARDVKVTHLKVCDSQMLPTDKEDSHCGEQFSSKTKRLYLCGEIEASNFAVLSIFLFKDAIKQPIYRNPVNDVFESGPFCREIILPSADREGLYQIQIYSFRNLIASIRFEVR